jgi:hypothetical protein
MAGKGEADHENEMRREREREVERERGREGAPCESPSPFSARKGTLNGSCEQY